jgi:hypothetical protein
MISYGPSRTPFDKTMPAGFYAIGARARPRLSNAPLEAATQDTFKAEPGVFEVDAAKDQMRIKRPSGQRVLRKEK